MTFSLLIATVGLVLADEPKTHGRSSESEAAYREAAQAAGRDPQTHVRLALWCERQGLTAERLKHLALAVLADPNHAAARGLMGQVLDDKGGWKRPSEVVEAARKDASLAATMAEYEQRRAASRDIADSQWDLAVWCEKNGLEPQARAHFAAVVRLDPKREAAWKRLGYRKVSGRWVNDELAAAEKAARSAQEKADRQWKPRLERWKSQLGDDRKRHEARASIASISDPLAVPSVLRVFAGGDRSDQALAIQILGQIPSRNSTRALAEAAAMATSPEVRRLATEALRSRDPREFADLLITLIRKPIKYEVRPVGGPGSPGVLLVEGKRVNLQRLYSPPPAPSLMPGDRFLGYDQYGLPIIGRYAGEFALSATAGDLFPDADWSGPRPNLTGPSTPSDGERRFLDQLSGASPRARKIGQLVVDKARDAVILPDDFRAAAYLENLRQPLNRGSSLTLWGRREAVIPFGQMQLEAQKAAATAQEQLEADVATLESYNAPINELNERATTVLEAATGLDYGVDRERWTAWYVDQLGYRYQPQQPAQTTPQFVVQQVPLAYLPQPIPVGVAFTPLGFSRLSCFGAGTPVHTRDGLKPIESIQVGDLVLSQHPRTGALSFEPVMALHHNPPSRTIRVQAGDESIVASEYHRFWEAGAGWSMARDLASGDLLRSLSGLREIASVGEGATQLVYNLDVAGGRTFFVGKSGLLVHDNSIPDLNSEPFDRPATLARGESSGR